MNIKTKITFLTLWLALCLTITLVAVVYMVQENLHATLDAQNKQILSNSIAERLTENLLTSPNTDKMAATLNQLNDYTDIVGACVFGIKNEFLLDYINDSNTPFQSSSTQCFNFSYPLSAESLSKFNVTNYNSALINENKVVGTLIIFVEKNKNREALRLAFVDAASPWLAVITLFAALILSVTIGRQFTPIIRFIEFTEKVATTKKYSTSFPVKGNNELSRLGKNINNIIGNIIYDIDISAGSSNYAFRQYRQTANFDSLTGLPNRQYIMTYLRAELKRVKQDKSDLVVMFFDLDGFKNINDTLGHDVGDSILRAVANRFKEHIRTGDTIARLGGDEFLLVPVHTGQDEVFALLAHKIVSAMKKPFKNNGLDLHLGVSIGIARASQANFELSELISYSDIAMYASKRAGKGQFTLFEENMILTHKRKLTIANGIIPSITNNEFVVFYQPKVNRDAHIVGFEALLRWTSPHLGEVPASEFIRIAESSGKIHEITRWVIQHVFVDINRFVRQFGPDIKISINLSALDLMQPNLIELIETNQNRYVVNPKNVEFEITESSYLENFNNANQIFNELSKKGYSVSLDDFGTGFSSLGYLAQISIHTLKIDKQFVLNMVENTKTLLVTKTIISLAKRLNLSVCAEGIESYNTFTILAKENCEMFQGYWFSKPLPIKNALELPFKMTVYLPTVE